MKNKLVVVRGGGDIATGSIFRLAKAGYQVIVLEIEKPTLVRRGVALAQCIFSGSSEVEGLQAQVVCDPEQAFDCLDKGIIPFLIDPTGLSIRSLKPFAVIDATLAKKNYNTSMDMAKIVVGLGPGFTPGKDVHAVVETMRGHNLGRVYYNTPALPDTGIPEEVMGFKSERVVRAPKSGIFSATACIGDSVKENAPLGVVNQTVISTPITGVVRGLLNSEIYVTEGMKIGDIDPRNEPQYCWTISDKARSISGGVMEALLYLSSFKIVSDKCYTDITRH